MPYRRGEVVLVFLPSSDLRTAKRRPALVVQADELHSGGSSQSVVALITSNPERGDHPSRVEVALGSWLGRQMGILTDSVVMTDALITVLDSEIDRVIGFCGDMTAVDRALRYTLAL